eukprot:58563-Rhodomonas_salina.2
MGDMGTQRDRAGVVACVDAADADADTADTDPDTQRCERCNAAGMRCERDDDGAFVQCVDTTRNADADTGDADADTAGSALCERCAAAGFECEAGANGRVVCAGERDPCATLQCQYEYVTYVPTCSLRDAVCACAIATLCPELNHGVCRLRGTVVGLVVGYGAPGAAHVPDSTRRCGRVCGCGAASLRGFACATASTALLCLRHKWTPTVIVCFRLHYEGDPLNRSAICGCSTGRRGAHL